MIRYWKLISLTAIVVLTIGIFYLQSSFAHTDLPNFVIKTKNGDEDSFKDLKVIGQYMDKGKETVGVQITEDETSYYSPRFTYLDMLKGEYLPDEIKDLQKKYRNFMRGKENENNFVENDELLVYAEINLDWSSDFRIKNTTYEIDVLQKDSKHVSSFSVPIPFKGDIDHAFILSLGLYGDLLHILTDSTINRQDQFNHQVNVHRLDIKSGKLLRDQEIVFLDDLGDSYMYPIIDQGENIENKYIIFVSNTYEEVEVTEEGARHETTDRELIIYNMMTGEQETIDLPEEVDLEFHVDSLIGDTIYLTKELEDVFQVVGYNIETEELETDYTIDLNQGPAGERVIAYLKDDYVAIISLYKSSLKDAILKVGDIRTGDILYEGSIEMDKKEKAGDYELEISHIEFE